MARRTWVFASAPRSSSRRRPAVGLAHDDGGMVRREEDHAIVAERFTDGRIDRDVVSEDNGPLGEGQQAPSRHYAWRTTREAGRVLAPELHAG